METGERHAFQHMQMHNHPRAGRMHSELSPKTGDTYGFS